MTKLTRDEAIRKVRAAIGFGPTTNGELVDALAALDIIELEPPINPVVEAMIEASFKYDDEYLRVRMGGDRVRAEWRIKNRPMLRKRYAAILEAAVKAAEQHEDNRPGGIRMVDSRKWTGL